MYYLSAHHHADSVAFELLAASVEGFVAWCLHEESLRIIFCAASAVLVFSHIVIGKEVDN